MNRVAIVLALLLTACSDDRIIKVIPKAECKPCDGVGESLTLDLPISPATVISKSICFAKLPDLDECWYGCPRIVGDGAKMCR